MTKKQAQLYGMQTQQGALFRDLIAMRPRERSDRGRFFAFCQKSLFIPGWRRHCLICLSVCIPGMCVAFVVLTDCESCARSIFTNPGSMEAGECGRTRGRVSLHAVSRWSRSPGCCRFRGVFWVGRIFSIFFFFRFFFSSNATACCKYEAASPHLPLY